MACKLRYLSWVAAIVFTVFGNFQEVLGQEGFDESYKKDPLVLKGDSLREREMWEEAIASFHLAEKKFKKEENWAGYIYALNEIGYCYRRDDSFDSAYVYLSKALNEGRELWGPEHPELGRTYYHLSYYYVQKPGNNIDSGEIAMKKSVEVREKSLPYFHKDLAQSYHGLGSFYRFQKPDIIRSIENYRRAVKIKEEILDKNDPDMAYSYQYLGDAYRELGDYHRSRYFLEEAVKINEANPRTRPTLVANALNNLANCYFDLEDFQKARDFYQKAIDYSVLTLGYDTLDLLNRLGNYGQALTFLGEFDLAKKIYKSILWYNQNPIKDSIQLTVNYIQYGAYLLEIGKHEEAKSSFEKALNLKFDLYGQKHPEIAESYEFLAILNTRIGNFDEAITNYQAAIISLEKNFNDMRAEANPQIPKVERPVELFKLISGKARVFYFQFRKTLKIDFIVEAIKLYDYLDRLSDIIKNGYFTDQLKLEISEKIKENATIALNCITIFNSNQNVSQNTELAFRLMEKSRYSQVFINLNKIQAVGNTNVPDSIYLHEKNLATVIQENEQLILGSRDSLQITELENNLFDLKREYQKLQEILIEKYPSYYQVKYDSVLLSVEEIQKQLDPSTQILEYLWTDSTVFVLGITKGSIDLTSIHNTESLRTNITSYQKFLNQIPSTNKSLDEYYSELAALSSNIYQSFLKPVRDANAKQLIISPDGPLAMIPFESLITDMGVYSFKTAPYLLKELDVQYVYNTNLLFKFDRKLPAQSGKLLAFSYSNEDELNQEPERGTLAEIPSSAREVKALSKIFGEGENAYFVGPDATETVFKQFSPNFGIIHLAVHGEADLEEEVRSRLIFKSDFDSLNDGSLFAYELYNLPLNNVNLAVLSACETGLGKELVGEGIYSMAHGFSYAGCPSTIMSLWRISDVTSSQIIETFYKNLKEGMGISEALRQAKLKYISESKSIASMPYFWAGFVALGDPSPTFKKNSFLRKYGFWIIPLILLMGLWYLRKRK